MALDDDLGHVLPIFVGKQHVQVHRQEAVDEPLAPLGQVIPSQLEQHVRLQGDGAVARVHLCGDAGLPKGAGQGRDDAGAHAHQGLQLALLVVQGGLLLVDLGLLVAQLDAQRVQLLLLGGDLVLLFLQEGLGLAQLVLLGGQDALGVVQIGLGRVQPDLLGHHLGLGLGQLRALLVQARVGLVQVVLLAGDLRHVDFIHIEILIHDVEHDQYEDQQQGAHQV